MAEEELKKVEELWRMGFIGEDEYKKRKEDILQANPQLAVSPSPSSHVQDLDLTTDETNSELLQLNERFEEFTKIKPFTYLISLHPAANSPCESACTSYLPIPKDCLQWLFHKQQFPESDISLITEICHSYPNRLFFAFSTLAVHAFDSELYQAEPYVVGEIVTSDIVIPAHRTNLSPEQTCFFQALNIPTRINRGQVEVIMDTVLIEKGETISELSLSLMTKTNIQRMYKNELVFVISKDMCVPARYTNDWTNPMAEAVRNVDAFCAELHYPVENRVPSAIRDAFWEILGFMAGVNDELVKPLNQDYVNSFTNYYVELENERKRQAEIEELDRTLKADFTEMEQEIAELKGNIAAFEHEYKDMKANFEDQDFNFNGLQMNVIPYQEKVLLANEKKTLPVLVEIKIGQTPESLERVPFSLAVILDRSGSMQGGKLTNCKKAISNIIAKMNDDDVLHFITYDDIAELEFMDGKKEQTGTLLKKVENVWARNCTNISIALERAITVFRDSASPYHKRAFLFSDGQANAGLTRPDQLQELAKKMQEDEKIITSTFGIGADFNYEIMDGIAKSGHGSYFFIDESENIPRLVDKGLRGLTSLLATDALLKIKPANGVKILKVFGHKAVDEIPVGDLRFGDLKQTLLEVEIDPQLFSEGNAPLLTFELVFQSQEQEKDTTFLPASGIQNVAQVYFTHDSQAVANQDINYQVEVTKVIKESADLDAQAIEAFRSGKIDKGIECKQLKMKELERVSLFDRYGFTKVLLQKTRTSLLEFMQAGLRAKTNDYNYKIVEINRKYSKHKKVAVYSSAHAGAAKSSELFLKQLAYEAKDEEEDDMGFGLFD
eukprot:Phypoly_transcript_02742.p1 GENE.Phypoly_transcript_02742~~Phypoly_transcript_02742.p1  ORF type:complete len:838 (+),score=174.48 Phypoly_transcript_02742:114-2627(+)